MKGRRDREYDRMVAAVGGGNLIVADDPPDVGAVLADVNKLLDVDVRNERLRKSLEDTKADLRDAKAKLDAASGDLLIMEALRRKVIDLTNETKELHKANKELESAVHRAVAKGTNPDYSEAKVRHAERRQRAAEFDAAELEQHARDSEERARKAEALVEHAQQHARDAEAAVEDAEARAEKAHAEGVKEGKTITQYAVAAAKQMLAAKNKGQIKAMTDDPIPDYSYLVRKAMQIEDRVREELTRKDGE